MCKKNIQFGRGWLPKEKVNPSKMELGDGVTGFHFPPLLDLNLNNQQISCSFEQQHCQVLPAHDRPIKSCSGAFVLILESSVFFRQNFDGQSIDKAHRR